MGQRKQAYSHEDTEGAKEIKQRISYIKLARTPIYLLSNFLFTFFFRMLKII